MKNKLNNYNMSKIINVIKEYLNDNYDYKILKENLDEFLNDLIAQYNILEDKNSDKKKYLIKLINIIKEIHKLIYRKKSLQTHIGFRESNEENNEILELLNALYDISNKLNGVKNYNSQKDDNNNDKIYVWHAMPGACETCEDLDGNIYYKKEDIPKKPHPNCKCTIETRNKKRKNETFNNKETPFNINSDIYKNDEQTNENNLNSYERIDHKKANELKELAEISDVLVRAGIEANGLEMPNGYKVKGSYYEKDSNFKAIAYEKNDEIIVTYVGTDFHFENIAKEKDTGSLKDLKTNVAMVAKVTTKQMKRADEIYKEIHKENPEKQIIVIGHSEGGSEAIYVATQNKVPAITFNAYGIGKNIDNTDAQKYVTNYRHENDPVSKARQPEGKNYIYIPEQNNEKTTLYGSIEAHRIENLGDLENTIPLDLYEKMKKIENQHILYYNNGFINNSQSDYEDFMQIMKLGDYLYNKTTQANQGYKVS